MANTTDILVRYKADVSDLVNESKLAENAVKEAGKAGKKAGDDTAAAFDKAGKKAKEFGSATKNAQKDTNVLAQGFNKIGGMIAGAFAIESVIAFGKASIEAFKQAELGAKKLEFAITQIAGGSNSAFKRLINQSSELESISIFSDDAIQQTQIQLAQFGLAADEIEKLTPKIIDLASATGDDLTTSTSKVIAALNGQTRGLKESGLAFEDTGTKVGNFNKFIEVSEKFAGSTATALNSAAGAAAQTANEIDNLQETIGEKLIPVEKGFFLALEGLISGAIFSAQALADVLTLAAFRGEGIVSKMKLDAQSKSFAAYLQGKKEFADEDAKIDKNAMSRYKNELQQMLKAQEVTTKEGRNKFYLLQEAIADVTEEINKQNDELTGLAKSDALAKQQKDLEEAEKKKIKVQEEAKKKAEQQRAEEKKKSQQEWEQANKELEAIKAAAAMRSADDLEGIENDRFKKEIQNLGLGNRKKEELTELELKALQNLEREHQDKLAEIRQAAREKQEKEDEEYAARQLEIQKNYERQVAAEAETGLIKSGASQKKIQKEQDRIKEKQLKDNLERLKNQDASLADIAEAELELAKQQEKIRMDNQKDVADNFSDLLKELENYQQKKFDMINKATADEISLQDKNIQRQKELADKGLQNTLAFEERKAAELKVRQMREQKAQERIKKLEVFLNTFADSSKTMKPQEALASALKAVALAEIGSMLFAEKGGIIGEITDRTGIRGGMFTKSHASGDRLVVASPNEAILSERDMKALGGRQGFYDLRKMLHSGDFEMRGIPKMYQNFNPVGIGAAINIDALVQEQKKTTEALKRIPVVHTGFDDVGNVIETWQKGLDKKITIIKTKKPRTA